MNKTDRHPSAQLLLEYASETLALTEVVALEDHIEACVECCAEVLMHRQLSDLDSLGLLPPAHTLRRPWGPSAGGKAGAPGRSGVLGIVGGALAGLGLGTRLPLHHGALARGPLTDTDSSSDHVRNAGDQSSHESQHEHSEDANVMSDSGSGFHKADTHYGHPPSDAVSSYVQQGYADTCAVQCQRLILNDFGIPVTEDQLVKEAQGKHLYSPGEGTHLEDVGKLLESHGLEVHRVQDANVFNLATELAQGHKVIVGLDSGELWHQNSVLDSIADKLGIGNADHAVIVSGIDTTDPQNVKVVITDPGTGDVAKQYPLHEFLDAWHTSHFSMVSTVDPVPSWHHEMVNFDYKTGHLSHIGAVPYDVAHELGTAGAHESDPHVLESLGSLFVSAASGQLPLVSWLGGHSGSSFVDVQGAMHRVVSSMVTLAHGGLSGEALAHSFASLVPPDPLHDSHVGVSHDPHMQWQEPDHHTDPLYPPADPADPHLHAEQHPDVHQATDLDPLDDPTDPSNSHHHD